MITINENFLPKPLFNQLLSNFTDLAWYWNDETVLGDSDRLYQFTHTWINKHGLNSDINLLAPLLTTIPTQEIYRIKANLNPPSDSHKLHGYHVDVTEEGYTTAIFYLTDNNGYTEFEDGTIITPKANTYIEFPASLKHRGATPTDSKKILININYK